MDISEMEPHGQARACTPKCLPLPKRFVPVFRHAGVVPQNHTYLRQGFGGLSADERNPPKRDTMIIALLSRALTHSSTAKAVVSCVGG